MNEITHKLVTPNDKDYINVLNMRYKAYFTGKNKTMIDSEELVDDIDGKPIMKGDEYDHYSYIFMIYFGQKFIGTVRLTIHKGQSQPAPMADEYPEIRREYDLNNHYFVEVSRAAVDESFRGKGFFLLYVYYLLLMITLQNDCVACFSEGPLRLAEVYNRLFGAELVSHNPRYYPCNNLPLYLVRVNFGSTNSIKRKRMNLYFYLLEKILYFHSFKVINTLVFPSIIVAQKMLLLDEKKEDFTKLTH